MFKYWGKAGLGDEPPCHPLVYHSLDVAAVGSVVLSSHPTYLRRVSEMIGLDGETTRRWLLWLLAHHDIGKFAAAFQRLKPELLPESIEDKFRYTQRHDTLGYLLWKKELIQGIFPSLEEYSPTEEAMLTLLRTSSGHHGKPPQEADWRSTWFRNEDIESARWFSAGISRLVFETALPPAILVDDESEFAERVAVASWAIAGFAVLCDWLGSNRVWFPFIDSQMDMAVYWDQIALRQALQAVEEAAIIPSPASDKTGFGVLFSGLGKPTALQRAADVVPLQSGPQLFLIEDLTGSGKTEAALTIAGRLLAAGNSDGLYVALPTTATADALYSRVGRVYRRFFAPDSRPSLVLAHSRSRLSAEFRESVGGERIETEEAYDDQEPGAAAICAAWLADNRKKALLAQVGVGTIDQALLAVLNVRHQSLRALGLLGKILIIDEVHACDAYMNQLLECLLRLHAALGGWAILISATLPVKTRRRLVEAFAEGAGFQSPDTLPVAYPQLLSVFEGTLWSRAVEAPSWSRRTLEFELISDRGVALDRIADWADDGRCVCWIRNTVGDAVEAFEDLSLRLGSDRVTLFHARFALGDRLEIEGEVLRRFGKRGKATERRGRVVVATQVIEQSLDLDFDEMVSDLAPIDLLLQRAGRLRRHRRNERGDPIDGPDRRGDVVLRVLSPEAGAEPDENWIRSFLPGTAAVYPHHGNLWQTTRFLSENRSLSLPVDLRRAVEAVFSEDSEFHPPEELQRVTCRVEGERNADESLAMINAIDPHQGYGGARGSWTDVEDGRTRLGEPTITLCLARWNGETLRPWFDGGPDSWALSEVSVRRVQAAEPGPVTGAALAQAADELERKKRFRQSSKLLVPLEENEDGTWGGSVFDHKGEKRIIRYAPDQGLEVIA